MKLHKQLIPVITCVFMCIVSQGSQTESKNSPYMPLNCNYFSLKNQSMQANKQSPLLHFLPSKPLNSYAIRRQIASKYIGNIIECISSYLKNEDKL